MLSPIPSQHKIALLQFFPSSHRTERIIRSIDKRISDAPFTDASPPIPESKYSERTMFKKLTSLSVTGYDCKVCIFMCFLIIGYDCNMIPYFGQGEEAHDLGVH